MLKRLEEQLVVVPCKEHARFSASRFFQHARFSASTSDPTDPRKEVPTRGPSIEGFGRGRPSAVPHSPEAARGCL